jgi:hypothetical protein
MELPWVGRETRREEARPRREAVTAAPPASPGTRPVEAAIEDRELVRRCQAGEESAFRELMRRYRSRAVYLAAQLLRDPHEAEDVAQAGEPRFGAEGDSGGGRAPGSCGSSARSGASAPMPASTPGSTGSW